MLGFWFAAPNGFCGANLLLLCKVLFIRFKLLAGKLDDDGLGARRKVRVYL